MRLDFLMAGDGTPLTKEFYKNQSRIEVTPYPMVRDFTSYSEVVLTPAQMYDAIVEYSTQGACLLKGLLDKELTSESRAGHTRAEELTEWICLDLDFEAGYRNIDEFLNDMDSALGQCTYIYQMSASNGIYGPPSLRGHIFIMLAEPQNPKVIKEWLRGRNLQCDALEDRIELSASGLTLKYPLDITTCQNDKLLFIAPPQLTGIESQVTTRIKLVRKAVDKIGIKLTGNVAKLRAAQNRVINKLRKDAGLEKRTPKISFMGGQEILNNPEPAAVTGVRNARGFTYINLNGGDSWGYFYPEDNPEFLYNFKGEPITRLEQVDPEYYRSALQVKNNAVRATGRVPLVFRNIKTDTYFNGYYYNKENSAEVYPVSSKDRLNDFLLQNGIDPLEVIEDWTYEFDPTTNRIIDFERKWLNAFVPQPHMIENELVTHTVPPTIHKILVSLCTEDQVIDRFINWLAYIYQFREKTKTAWIFHGTSGTGKGLLFEQILQPLFGKRYVSMYTNETLEDKFNSDTETALIQFFDEFKVDNRTSLLNKIKHLITEDTTVVRKMRQEGVQRRVYNNVIMATNEITPIKLDPADRRFNVPPAQEIPLKITRAEVKRLPDEVLSFAAMLRDWDVDKDEAQVPIKTEAKQEMVKAALSSIETILLALRTGDIQYFLSYIYDKPKIPSLEFAKVTTVIMGWAEDAMDDRTIGYVGRDDLRLVYNYLNGSQLSPNKFSSLCAKYRIIFEPKRIDGVLKHVLPIEWNRRGHIIETSNEPKVIDYAASKRKRSKT